MICPSCKKKIPDDSNFCGNCGCCVDSSIYSTPVAAISVNKKKRLFQVLFVLVCGILLALVIVFIGSIVSSGKKIAEYEQTISQYEQQVSQTKKTEDLVFIPDDDSYLYHRYECKKYDHNLYCYVTSVKIAESNGCKPCPYCLDGK